MRLFGQAALHGLVVRVHAGVVVDLEGRRMQGCGDLLCALVSGGCGVWRWTWAYLESDGVLNGSGGHV